MKSCAAGSKLDSVQISEFMFPELHFIGISAGGTSLENVYQEITEAVATNAIDGAT